jgi:hypothetical protein
MPDEQIHTAEPELFSDARTLVFYSNYTAVTMTPDEVVLRFAERDLGDATKALEMARLIVSPAHAKRLMSVLVTIIKTYETNFGPLVVDPLQRLTPEGRKNLGINDPNALE